MSFFVKQGSASGQNEPKFLSLRFFFPFLFVSTNFIVAAVYCVDRADREMTLSTQIHTKQLLLLCVLC